MKNLDAQIDTFGDAILAAYDAATQAAMGAAEGTLASQKAWLAAENSNLQDSLWAHTQAAIDAITAARENLQATLDDAQDAQEHRDEEACEVLKVALVTTKNTLWKNLSWLTRRQFSHAGYGLRHNGYGYGYSGKEFNHHDEDEELAYHDDDHHDYHDHTTVAHTHGYAQWNYYGTHNFGYTNKYHNDRHEKVEEIKATKQAMVDAQAQTKADHDAIIAASLA